MVTRTRPSPAVARRSRHGAQLVGGEVALVHAHGDGGVTGLLLLDARWSRARRRIPDRRGVAGSDHRQQRAIAQRLRVRLVAAETFRHHVRPGDAAVGQNVRRTPSRSARCSQAKPRSRSTNFMRALFLFLRLPYWLKTRMMASQRLSRRSSGTNSSSSWASVGSGPRPPPMIMRKPRLPSRITARSPISLMAPCDAIARRRSRRRRS